MMSTFRKIALAFTAALGLMLASSPALADPPYRVARLAYASGNVSFSPAGEADWSRAAINRPLYNGDRLWVADRSRAELQLGGTAVRIGDETSLAVLDIGDRIAQFQLTQGEMQLRVWRVDPGQVIEVDTPNLAYVIRQPGNYHIDVDTQDGSTGATVLAGSATLYGEGHAFRIGPGDTWRFYDTALRDYDTYRPSPADDLQRWAAARDARWDRSASARYVSREMIGYEDLDEYGSWRQVADYGWVWVPTRVSSDWAPYREGHWSWVEPWGWTWVDNEPWGFAPSHYGRWAYADNRWCWVPGPANVRPVYAPALVAFIGGSAISAAVGGGGGVVGWFPLAPREVYRPSYRVSRDYFTRVNVSNTVVNVTQVTKVYQSPDAARNLTYANRRAPNAVIAVPTQAFTQAKPVAREAVKVRVDNVQPQAIVAAAPVAPAKQSVLGPQPAAQRPPEQAFRRPVVAQTAPPPPPAPIESKLPALQQHPGQPLPPAPAGARPATPSAAAAPAPAVKVIQPTQPAAAPPPPAPAANRPERERRREERRGEQPAAPASSPAAPGGPAAARPTAPTPPAASPIPPPAPASAPQPGRGAERQRGERPAPGASRPVPPAAAPTPSPAAPPGRAAEPPAASQPQRGPQREEQQREQQQRAQQQQQQREQQQRAQQERVQQQQEQQRAQQQQAQQQRAQQQQQRAEERRQAASEQERGRRP